MSPTTTAPGLFPASRCPIYRTDQAAVYHCGDGWAWRVDYVSASGFTSEAQARASAAAFLSTCPEAPRFGVLCSTTGGVTGSRRVLLKDESQMGELAEQPLRPQVFDTEAEARAEARKLAGNVRPYGPARISFAPVRLTEGGRGWEDL